MSSRTFFTTAAVLAVLAAAGGGVAFWKYRMMHSTPAGGGMEPAESVQVITARTAPWTPMAKLVGTVFAIRSVTVSNEVAGVVSAVSVGSGAVVEEGQVLLTLDSSTEQADLAAAEASVRVMEASVRMVDSSVELWGSNVRRLSTATEVKAAAATDLDNARSQLATAVAQRDRARAEFDQAKSHVMQVRALLEKKTIRAPFRARAGLRDVQPGQYLAEGTTIVTLQGVSDEIYLDFAVPQEQAARVKPGDTVSALSEVLGSKPVLIKVAALDATANPTTRNIRIRSIVPNQEQRLRPGMFVDVSVPIGDEGQFVTIPSTAVRRASFGDHVFVLTPGESPDKTRAKQRFIKLGPAIGPDVIVLEGLKAGEEIAASGSFKLRDGALVLRGATPAAPTSPPPAGAPKLSEK